MFAGNVASPALIDPVLSFAAQHEAGLNALVAQWREEFFELAGSKFLEGGSVLTGFYEGGIATNVEKSRGLFDIVFGVDYLLKAQRQAA